MKHGAIALALLCGIAVASFATEIAVGSWSELSADEMAVIQGGDLMLAVNRDKQMMTVTRITPGNYDNIQCYSVKVTTSVVRNRDVSPANPKGAMENTVRALPTGADKVLPKQFPTGTATLQSVTTTQSNVQGPVIKTNATQIVSVVDADRNKLGERSDTGYNVHFVDPVVATNTWGCVGVQSQSGMDKVVSSLKLDNASYAAGATPNQTIIVSDYTNGTPSASTFSATGTKTAETKTATKASPPKTSDRPLLAL